MKERYLNEIKNKSLNDKLIYDIVSYPNWYLKVNIDVFINILISLDYTKEKAIDIYKVLLKVN